MTDSPGDVALAEFRRRQATASQRIAEGGLAVEQANAALRPWASIVVRSGRDLPELEKDLDFWHRVYPGNERLARAGLAAELCVLARCRSILATAIAKAAAANDQPAAAALDKLTRLLAPKNLRGARTAPQPRRKAA